jgi:hypothetical protein
MLVALLMEKGTRAARINLSVLGRRQAILPRLLDWKEASLGHPLVEERLSGLPAGAFGSFERIQLHNLLAANLHVGGEITGAAFPLDLWFWAGLAENAFR